MRLNLKFSQDEPDWKIKFPNKIEIKNYAKSRVNVNAAYSSLHNPYPTEEDLFTIDPPRFVVGTFPLKKGESACIIEAEDWDQDLYCINCEVEATTDINIKVDTQNLFRGGIQTFMIEVDDINSIQESGEYFCFSDEERDQVNKFFNKNYKYIFATYN